MSPAARNNVLAGVFVIMGMALAVAASFLLAERSGFGEMRRFTVRFSIAQGATGLKRGSAVLLGGQQVGRVLKVTFEGPEAGSPGTKVPHAVDVSVEARADLVLFENAAITLERPLLGSLSSINIRSVGDPATITAAKGAGPTLDDGEVVEGRVAPPGFLADAGFGPEQGEQLRVAIGDLQKTITGVSDLVERSGPKVDAGLEDAQKLLAELRESLTAWTERVDTTIKNVEAASARLDPILSNVNGGVDDARTLIADGRKFVDGMQSLVDENREHINSIVRSVESASAKFDRETLSLVNDALREGRAALDTFAAALKRVETLLVEETPGVRRTLANLRIMSDQLKLTSIEVRSQPWRLLHTPTTKEMEQQVLYDATRAYAEASSDLRAAAEALKDVNATSDPAGVEETSRALAEALAKYRTAEGQLLDALVKTDR